MSRHGRKERRPVPVRVPARRGAILLRGGIVAVAVLLAAVLLIVALRIPSPLSPTRANIQPPQASSSYRPTEKWLQRAYAIDVLFHRVYTQCWEGAYGAIGDAHLFAVTRRP